MTDRELQLAKAPPPKSFWTILRELWRFRPRGPRLAYRDE